VIAQNSQKQRDLSLLRKLFLLSAIIIIANCLIGIFARVSGETADDITFLDVLWRVVTGQRVGIDFHYPLGIGPYQLGALLWSWLGPHFYVMRLAITLINLSIAVFSCVVAERTLARRSNLALLFCATVAFQVSAPTVYGSPLTLIGISEFYNRHIIAALAVLFLQTFGGGPTSSKRESAIEAAIAGCLLNILFMIKISGFLLGLMILFAGCLLQGRTAHRILSLCAAMLAFAAITAIEFKATGLELTPLIQEYELAAHARLAYPLKDLVKGVMAWPFSVSVALLILFAVSQRPGELRPHLRCIVLIIGVYAACQFALNITSDGAPSMWLAPAAIASLAVRMNTKPIALQGGGLESWWRRFTPSLLAEISARQAIPLLIFVLVLLPEIMSSIVGVTIGALVSLGIDPKAPYVITAGKGISFVARGKTRSYNGVVTAISSLNLGNEAIANLDLANPFPVLFLAPPPKGIQVFWHFGVNIPRDALLDWQDVIGDACVVTIPTDPWVMDSTVRLVDIVRLKLATDFKLVYQDALWSIYQETRGCVSAPHRNQ
jgi:hypothetical protein